MSSTTEPTPADRLAGLGLVPDDEIRYQRVDGGKWYILTVFDAREDGSIDAIDHRNGRRTLDPSHYAIEVKRRGPRGGEIWEKL